MSDAESYLIVASHVHALLVLLSFHQHFLRGRRPGPLYTFRMEVVMMDVVPGSRSDRGSLAARTIPPSFVNEKRRSGAPSGAKLTSFTSTQIVSAALSLAAESAHRCSFELDGTGIHEANAVLVPLFWIFLSVPLPQGGAPTKVRASQNLLRESGVASD